MISLCIKIFHKAAKCLRVILCHWRESHPNFCVIKCTGKTTDVICMCMGANDVIKIVNLVLLKIRIKETRVVWIASINQHIMSIAFYDR